MNKTELWLLYFGLVVLGARPWRSDFATVEQKHELLVRELGKALGVRWLDKGKGFQLSLVLEPAFDYFIAALAHEPKPQPAPPEPF